MRKDSIARSIFNYLFEALACKPIPHKNVNGYLTLNWIMWWWPKQPSLVIISDALGMGASTLTAFGKRSLPRFKFTDDLDKVSVFAVVVCRRTNGAIGCLLTGCIDLIEWCIRWGTSSSLWNFELACDKDKFRSTVWNATWRDWSRRTQLDKYCRCHMILEAIFKPYTKCFVVQHPRKYGYSTLKWL